MHFCCNYSFASLSNFLPTLVKNMGFSPVNAQGLTAPVYLAAFVLSILSAWYSDRIGNRGWFVCGFAGVGCIGYVLLATVEDVVAVRYAAIWLICCGVFPALSLNVTWLFNNQGGDSKKGAGFAIFTTVGQTSSFVSSVIFPSKDA
jgi:MFS family permease